jgi:hypothetical protein
MAGRIQVVLLTIVLGLTLGVARSDKSIAKDNDLKPEELIAAHIKSIGSPEVLSKVKSRALRGATSVQFRLGGTGQLTGQFQLVSEGRKLGLVMKFNTQDYSGEYLAFDGTDVTVSNINPGQKSPLADFIHRNGGLMKEGLFGGVLSVGWPLLEAQKSRAKMSYRKSKIGGRQLHELSYNPGKGLGDVKVKMFFDLETFRHVRTEYVLRVNALGARSEAAANPDNSVHPAIMDDVPDTIDQLVEQFDDFKEVDGMMLPHHYAIQLSIEGQGQTFLGDWIIDAQQWIHNNPIDPQAFIAK